MRVRRRPADEIGLQIAPMCDVVFLILTFFLLTTELSKTAPQRLAPVILPLAPDAGRAGAGAPLTVAIDARGRFFLGDRPVDAAALRAALNEAGAGTGGGKLRVRLRADAAAPARAVKDAVAWSAAAGASEVVIGARTDERP